MYYLIKQSYRVIIITYFSVCGSTLSVSYRCNEDFNRLLLSDLINHTHTHTHTHTRVQTSGISFSRMTCCRSDRSETEIICM